MNAEQIYDEAVSKALKAIGNVVPTPMGVYQSDLMGNRLGSTEVVSEGPCGFAWVLIKPARGKFVNYMKQNKIGRKGVYGGYHISISHLTPSQSYERAMAGAKAFAEVLNENGIKCSPQGRLD